MTDVVNITETGAEGRDLFRLRVPDFRRSRSSHSLFSERGETVRRKDREGSASAPSRHPAARAEPRHQSLQRQENALSCRIGPSPARRDLAAPAMPFVDIIYGWLAPPSPPDHRAAPLTSGWASRLSDGEGQGERSPSRLIVSEVAAVCRSVRGPDGLAPEPPADRALAWSGFRSRCRPVGSRRGVARKRCER